MDTSTKYVLARLSMVCGVTRLAVIVVHPGAPAVSVVASCSNGGFSSFPTRNTVRRMFGLESVSHASSSSDTSRAPAGRNRAASYKQGAVQNRDPEPFESKRV